MLLIVKDAQKLFEFLDGVTEEIGEDIIFQEIGTTKQLDIC